MAKDENPLDSIIDLAVEAKGLYEQHEGEIRSLFESRDTLSLRDTEMLKDASKTEEEVYVTADIGTKGMEDIGFSYKPDSAEMVIEVGQKNLIVEMPYDVVMDKMEFDVNNGVLSVSIPRGGDEEDGEETEVNE